MTNISRRHFIYGVSLIPLTSGAFVNAFTIEPQNPIFKSAMFELLQVLTQWQQKEALSPEEFLAERGINFQNKTEISDKSQQDFIRGDLFEVKGLVLAKTEAAAIALAVERFFST